jgi:hypothetical protein
MLRQAFQAKEGDFGHNGQFFLPVRTQANFSKNIHNSDAPPEALRN